MKQLLYIANIRLPTEKAHGLQIMQNCEAFADAGVQVLLWAARRFNVPELRYIQDVYAYYGVKRNFTIERLPCIDLFPLSWRWQFFKKTEWFIFYLQYMTFALVVLLRLFTKKAEIYYSRDTLLLLAMSFIKPRSTLVYEAHSLAQGKIGRWLQKHTARRVGMIVAVTGHLQAKLIEMGAKNTLVAHDGFRGERFANLPIQSAAREKIGWSKDAFIVGYVGRLHTMGMDKGVGLLIDALAQVEGASLALVGGPDDMAEILRLRWLNLGLDAVRFLYAGQVKPQDVPLYLSAFDVCAMPFPWTEHFAYYASPIKLFEYMAVGCAIVASDLPSTAEVACDGESALLVPPSDVAALAAALIQLHENPALREKLGQQAAKEALHYTWQARAEHILASLNVKK